jgi:hypothetical protein
MRTLVRPGVQALSLTVPEDAVKRRACVRSADRESCLDKSRVNFGIFGV